MTELVAGSSASSRRARFLSRFRIGPRLAACFLSIILFMLVGNSLLIWQFYQVREEVRRLATVDQQLITVLQFQTSLRLFYSKLNELAQSRNQNRLIVESEGLQRSLGEDANRTAELFRGLPPGSNLTAEVLSVVESVQSSLPAQLEAMRALAASGEWDLLRLRISRQLIPLEALSSDLVRVVDHDVATERAQASLSIARAQHRMLLIFLITGTCSLLAAGLLGAGITRSITEPLHGLQDASQALARGDFRFQIVTRGQDELSQLGLVFNDMVGKLGTLYDDLRNREARLRESDKELRELIEFVPMHVFVLRPDRSGLYANRRLLDYYGLTQEEWNERGFNDGIVHPNDRKRYREEFDKGFKDGVPFETEVRIAGKDGSHRWFLSRFNPMMDEQGAILRWYVARTDIEEAKQEVERTQSENLALREEVNLSSAGGEIMGSSDNIVKVLSEISRVAPTDSTVLILGETGTGKELVARAIHKQSKRADRAFIRVNCAAIPPSLVSAELFGHEKGAFTGAVQRRLGRFEAANGGTIFLDEVGELPHETQVTLLRVLQEREFERVGSNQPISVDVRILAATNRDLKAAAAAGTFRQDLFYRLNVFPIQLPPLRDRQDDIPLLVEYFIDRYAAKSGKKIRSIKRSTFELFRTYGWPGNIRELQNVVERAVLLCDGETLAVDDSWFKQEIRVDSHQGHAISRGLERLEVGQERELIEGALAECGGRISGPAGAATKLGIPRQTLESKIVRLGIDRYRFLRK